MSSSIFDVILAKGLAKGKTEKQQRVIEAAIKLFAKKGYANTSTAEIAKVAGVSEGAIFKQYGTKDQLLLSVMLPFVTSLFPVMAKEAIDEVLSKQTMSFEQFLRDLIKNRVVFINEHKEIFRVVVKELMYKEELKKELIPYIIQQAPLQLTPIVEQFKEQGELIDLPTDRILKILFTLLGGFFVSRFLLLDNYVISEEEVEDVVQFVMKGLSNRQSAG